jgi:hypothetical protein
MHRGSAIAVFTLAMGVLLFHGRGFAQPGPDHSVISTGLTDTRVSSTAAPTTLSFFYGKRQTFRNMGIPQRWANLLGNAHNNSGITSLTYTLNGGPSKSLGIGPDTRRLFNEGDFNIDLSWQELLPLPDSNIVIVTATANSTAAKKDTVVVRFSANTHWPLPTTVVWNTFPDVVSAAQVVDGQWVLEGSGVRDVDFGYDRLLAIGDTTWTDYEVTVPVTIHSINADGYNPTSGQPVVGLFLRWRGHTDDPVSGWQPKSGWNPSGALGMYAFNAVSAGGERLEIWKDVVDGSGKKIPLEQTTLFKMHVESRALGDFYALRVWPQGEAEPAVWDLTYLDVSKQAARGSALLLSHYVDATFGDVTIAPLTGLPVQLAQFSGSAVGEDRVTLTWRTLGETSNYGFEVERAANEPRGYTLIPGSFIAGHGTTIVPHEYVFTDSSATPGVWYYRLRQIDLDGADTHYEAIRISVGAPASVPGGQLPTAFALHQNYPNPFNPVTTIRFELPVPSPVRLTVHDILGREVATLLNTTAAAGSHEVTFEASGLASGTYMYRLQAGGFVRVKRLMVVK